MHFFRFYFLRNTENMFGLCFPEYIFWKKKSVFQKKKNWKIRTHTKYSLNVTRSTGGCYYVNKSRKKTSHGNLLAELRGGTLVERGNYNLKAPASSFDTTNPNGPSAWSYHTRADQLFHAICLNCTCRSTNWLAHLTWRPLPRLTCIYVQYDKTNKLDPTHLA